MFRTVVLITFGSVMSPLLGLVRNLVIARLIPVEDYGVAATFGLIFSLVELISTLGMQQQIVQSKDGDDPRFQAGLHGFQFLRGVMAAATLFLAAGWIAEFLGIPEVAWAYRWLAVLPLLNGLQHFDVFRLTRQMRYREQIIADLVPAALSLAVVLPAFHFAPDFRVMLIALLVQWGMLVGLSHVVAERRYKMSFDRQVIASALQFGWPLLINNLMLFLVLNGDKMIVGREMGMTDLAILAMGYTLTLTPTLVLAKMVQRFFLPQLSAVQHDPERFNPVAMATLQAVIFAALGFLLLLILAGGPFVRLVLDTDYAALPPLLVWFGILQVLRVMKAGGAVVALARGQTSNAMIANAFRVVSLPVAWLVAIRTGDLWLVLMTGIVGEGMGLVASLVMLRYRLRIPMRPLVLPFAAAVAGLAVAVWHGYGLTPETAARLPEPGTVLAITALLAAMLWSMPALRSYVSRRQIIKFEA